jgi:hypothetical protein
LQTIPMSKILLKIFIVNFRWNVITDYNFKM